MFSHAVKGLFALVMYVRIGVTHNYIFSYDWLRKINVIHLWLKTLKLCIWIYLKFIWSMKLQIGPLKNMRHEEVDKTFIKRFILHELKGHHSQLFNIIIDILNFKPIYIKISYGRVYLINLIIQISINQLALATWYNTCVVGLPFREIINNYLQHLISSEKQNKLNSTALNS